MSTVRSADGTTIGYTRIGQGPPLILVDGALCSRSFGPMPKLAAQLAPHFTVYTYDRRGRGESGDTQPYAPDREIEDLEALVAGRRRRVRARHVVRRGPGPGGGQAPPLDQPAAAYEPPFIVDGRGRRCQGTGCPGWSSWWRTGRRGDAVKMFMRFVGTPAVFTAIMPVTPVWAKLKAVAPTLPYDITIMHDHQQGTPLTPGE